MIGENIRMNLQFSRYRFLSSRYPDIDDEYKVVVIIGVLYNTFFLSKVYVVP